MLWQLAVLLLAFVMSSCEEQPWYNSQEGETPQPVSNVKVEPGAGAAVITYDLPDENVMYVSAEYEIRDGVHRNSRASRYVQNLSVDGFPKAGAYDITLYTVGKGEKKSEPVVVPIEISDPPVITTYNSIGVIEDFGGITINAVNEHEGDLVFEIFSPDSTGDLQLDYTHYTKLKNIKFSVRGYEAEPRNFHITMRDRWSNTTDTLSLELTPLFEERLDRTIMKEVQLPTDSWEGHSWGGIAPRGIHFMFNGVTNAWDQIFHSKPPSQVPIHFTFDLGKKAKLSRYKLWQRWEGAQGELHTYAGLTPRKWELYGSNDPNPDGSWDSWTLLGEYTMEKPSGLPAGQLSQEDWDARNAGNEFIVPLEAPAVRYLRMRVLETWGRTNQLAIAELEFWGVYKE